TAKPKLSAKEREKQIRILEKEMKAAAKALEFEKAAALRDEIRRLQEEE
ncbi:MAG: UvrB/UvrC motif-containing protein, partial [Peptococcaceae bacterium]|nr:UvrB/UvrC motif-containing protein [Peptococcaceae bacterium]